MPFEQAPSREHTDMKESFSKRMKRKLKVLTWAVALGAESYVGYHSAVNLHEKFKQDTAEAEQIQKQADEKAERSEIEHLLEGKYKRLLTRYHENDIEDTLISAEELNEKYNERKSRDQEGIAIDAIETHDGLLRQEQVQDVVVNLPQSWTIGKIESIHFLKGVEKADKGYAPSGVLADETPNPATGESSIRFFGSAKNESVEYVIETIDHEVAHANDWQNRPGLSLEERLAFWTKVSDRSFAADRYYSSYVEGIKDKDLGAENYYKTIEYWAEICQAYFNHPDDLDVNDFRLVDRFVKNADPAYNLREAVASNHALAEAVREESRVTP